MHTLKKAIAMMGFLAPLGASALGIGDIRLHSALNQSLDAEIPLVLSGADSLSDVKIGLAGPEAFAKAGVERHHFLTKLQFRAVQNPTGGYVIKVSSHEAMHEPFLSFLLEVNWPEGRMLREFTVLLDPPSNRPDELTGDPPPMAERPIRHFESLAEPESSAATTPAPRRLTQKTVASTQEPAPAPPTSSSEKQLTNETYGPVQRHENLWEVAKALRDDSPFTHEQIAVALYRTNPQAFGHNNINTLKAGSVLRIPTQEFIAEIDPEQARLEFARQHGWNSERLMTSRAPAASTEGETLPGQLRLPMPTEASSKEQGKGGIKATGSKVKSDLAIEIAEAAKQENEEFRSRLAQLEQKLADMQRMLSLKDEQIAVLEARQHAAAPSAAEVPSPAAQPQAPAAQPAPAQAPTGVQSPSVPSPEQVQPPPVAPKPPEISAPETPPQTAPAPRSSATQPAPSIAEESETSSDLIWWALAGGSLILGLAGWLIQRRRKAMVDETESLVLATERKDRQATPASKPASRPAGSTVEVVPPPASSLLSEFTPSDLDFLGAEADEMDPISEADVYVAYGRYKQAEELIRNAIAEHPERHDYKLKLLEIYYTTENRAAFQNYAQELKTENMDAQTGFWAKVKEMGQELVPGNSLFQTPAASEQETASQDVNLSKGSDSFESSEDLIDDLKRFEIEFTDPASAGDTELVVLDPDAGPEDSASQTGSLDKTDRFAPLDFDTSSLNSGKSATSEPGSKPEETLELENLIHFDFGKPLSESQATSAAQAPTEISIDDVLHGLGKSTTQDEGRSDTGSAGAERNLETLEFDLDSFESELASALEESHAESEPDQDTGDLYASLTDMDQIETKLDLAKAYAAMNDEDAAVEILNEVLAKGSDNQKLEARNLLGKMGRSDRSSEVSTVEPRSRRR